MKPVHPSHGSTGIDLAAAREKLRGLPARRLDGDWLAVDGAGHVAFFAGNEHGPIPDAADSARVGDVLDALARTASAMRRIVTMPEGYRHSAEQANEPIFDSPRTTLGAPAHEKPIDGYPLLVVGTHPALREIAVEWNGRDASAREGFAVAFPSIGSAVYEELHYTDLCVGCRLLDDPLDPRPRAPEVLAAAGLYVYAHADTRPTLPYRRVASPSVPARVVDLERIAQLVASGVKLDVSFEDATELQPRDFLPCAR